MKINFNNFVYNASGVHCTTLKDLQELDNCKFVDAVLSKTCTLQPRTGNPQPRYFSDGLGSINSTGLANLGIDQYLTFVAKNKPYIISIASVDTDDDYYTLLEKIRDCENVNGIEINVSCPNIVGKPQLGYDFERLDSLLKGVQTRMATASQTLGIKLPPYMDTAHYERVAKIINKYPVIKFIVCCNSIGNCLLLHNGVQTIMPNNGLGGLGGVYVKPLCLANVKIFGNLLNDDIQIIGCGGISTKHDINDYHSVGAAGVQIGTFLYENGLSGMERFADP